MSKKSFASLLSLAGIGMPLLLSGCGESTNIKEGGSANVTQCSSLLNVSCVPGRFVDDAAANINYECGLSTSALVRSVTDVDGGFACPSGSIARFSLVNPDDPDSRIDLGEVKIVLPAQIYGGNPLLPVYFYVTPRTLAEDAVGSAFSTKALNITRLLQTLSDDTVDSDLTGHLPSRRILITDDDKRKITAAVLPDPLNFTAPIASDPTDPSAGSFDEQAQEFLESLSNPAKHKLISRALAEKALQKGIHNTVSGIYQVPGGSIITIRDQLTGNNNFSSADFGAMVGTDTTTGNKFVSSMYMLADRRGRVIGHGVYSFGQAPSTSLWNPWSDPQPMTLVRTGPEVGGFPVWPNDGLLNEFRFEMRGSNDVGKYVRLGQGRMNRSAVAGSAKLYSELFKESSVPGQLGTWTMGSLDGTVTNVSNGQYTLEHTLEVATLMNPDIWGSVTFPLPITVTIYNRDFSNTSCVGGRGCKMADLRMVILQDGNIISDRYKACGADVNPETLVVAADPTRQEIPLGVVASSQSGFADSSSTTIKAMVLLAMLPGDYRLNDTMAVTPGYEQYLPYLQFGSNLRASHSVLRVDAGANQFQMYGTCDNVSASRGLCALPGFFQPKMGSWINGHTAMRLLQASDNNAPAATITTLAVNSEGYMEAKRTDAADCIDPTP